MHNRRANCLVLLGVLSCSFIVLGLTYGLGFQVPCPLKTLTGIPCPGCGGMRSLDALLRGEFLTAITINPLSVLLIAVIAVSCLWLVWDIIQGTRTYTHALKKLNNRYFLWIILLLLAAIWGRNILSGI